ncbi:sulfurtransferase TusA family protein, partial [Kaarinaea lacus]
VDACGLNSPGPIMKLSKAATKAKDGDMITITATDSAFETDISTWSNKKGFKIVNIENNASKITAVIQKL